MGYNLTTTTNNISSAKAEPIVGSPLRANIRNKRIND
jgi:hypothetical protein